MESEEIKTITCIVKKKKVEYWVAVTPNGKKVEIRGISENDLYEGMQLIGVLHEDYVQQKYSDGSYSRDTTIEEYLEVDYEKDGEVIGKKIIATGTKNHVDWNCSNVINEAKKIQADKVVLIHNHPSGNINASEQDRITKEEVSKKMDKENIKSEFVIVTKYQERKY